MTGLALLSRFQQAFGVSVLLHLAALVWIGFLLAPTLVQAPQEFEVVLVNHASRKNPTDATRLAQNALDGGGDVEEDRHRASPLAASEGEVADATLREQQRVAALEKEASRLMTALKARVSAESLERGEKPVAQSGVVPDPSTKSSAVTGIGAHPKGDALSREAAEISREFDDYQKRPRRLFVGGRTRAYLFAAYEDNYRARVERMGTLHYPVHPGERVYGKVRITASINAAGKLVAVKINTSSGDSFLDQAALDIVRRSAPFGVFTPAMKKKADILDITRTFNFKRDSVTLKAD